MVTSIFKCGLILFFFLEPSVQIVSPCFLSELLLFYIPVLGSEIKFFTLYWKSNVA